MHKLMETIYEDNLLHLIGLAVKRTIVGEATSFCYLALAFRYWA